MDSKVTLTISPVIYWPVQLLQVSGTSYELIGRV